MLSTSRSKVAPKLSKSCPKVVQKLSKSCSKVVQQLSNSCPKVVWNVPKLLQPRAGKTYIKSHGLGRPLKKCNGLGRPPKNATSWEDRSKHALFKLGLKTYIIRLSRSRASIWYPIHRKWCKWWWLTSVQQNDLIWCDFHRKNELG